MTAQSVDNPISERAQHLLKVLVERYIREGQPVGSRTLSRDSGLELSPASIRNIMADLEELGFVAAPHTSAGRIPTVKGYRFFVDTLIKVRPLNLREIQRLQQHLTGNEYDPRALVASASSLLSGITHMAGVVTVPRREQAAWRQIEFLPLSDRRVLAILVVNEREVQNRILQLDRDYTEDELQRAANYLNDLFRGRGTREVRERLLAELRETRATMNDSMSAAIGIAEKVFERDTEVDEDGFVLAGETNLMEFAELSDVEKLRGLFDAFSRKRDILHLLDNCIAADGVQIFIGEEAGYKVLDDCSVITAPYTVDEDVVGVLGVIGPTRMAYERVIPIVDVTAKLLGAALKSGK